MQIRIDCTPVWNKLPWITPSKFFNITLRPNRFFSNDDFGSLTGTESLFRGVRGAVIYPLFIRCDNSPDKSIIHVITDKLTRDIHSMFSLLTCQFMKYRSTASVWFPKCLNLAMYGIFWCTKFFCEATSTFTLFSSKTLLTFSIFYNLGLPQGGKPLVFSFPVLKRWDHCCVTCSLTTLSPSISHTLRAAAAAALWSCFQ